MDGREVPSADRQTNQGIPRADKPAGQGGRLRDSGTRRARGRRNLGLLQQRGRLAGGEGARGTQRVGEIRVAVCGLRKRLLPIRLTLGGTIISKKQIVEAALEPILGRVFKTSNKRICAAISTIREGSRGE